MKKNFSRIASVLSTWAFCFLIYLALCWSVKPQELVLGAITSFVVALFASRFMIHENPVYLLAPKRIFSYLLYLFILFPIEMIRANFDVARRALSPKCPVNPGIVRIPTKMRSDYGIMMLANAITLTPGTITLEVAQDEENNNYFYVHWIDVTQESGEAAGKAIKGRLEKWLRRVWK